MMRIRTPYWGLVSALVCLLATGSLAGAATISVPAGGNLQDAIDAAKPGDVITLEPGATYIGNFVLRNKGATNDYITLRSAAPDSALPGPGVRMTPKYAAQLPKIRSSNNMSALRTATGANHYKLLFLEFQANVGGFGDVIALGAGDSTQTMLSQVPYALVIDRIYLHGDPVVGQKRGISLHGSDTQVLNSYVSQCMAIGQDSQAISGFNGPGNYLIQNNYLEGATENFLLGGADPTIPNLVTTNVTFRHNHLSKPLAWRDPIVATPTGASAQVVAAGGSLAAGTYAYRVAARLTSNQDNKATSASSVEVSAAIAAGPTGGVRVSWTAVPGAEQYLVYGRTAGGQTMYWKTSDTYFTDTGAAGTAVTPGGIEKPTYAGTKWSVKNTFELKNAQDVFIEGNVFEYVWVADQTGYPIVFTPRNQGGRAGWTVVQRVTFVNNLVRHTAGGVNILGTDNLNPSQRTNTITVTDNVFDDLTPASWGSGSRPFMLGDGPDNVTISHNTVFSTNPQLIWLYGAPATNTVFTNNMARHNTYGIMANGLGFGNDSINQFLPGVNNVTANVIAGGSASKYPAGNFFPTASAWMADFTNYATGDYRLREGSPFKGIGLDGKDLGADIDTLDKHVPIALSGKDDGSPLTIAPATLADGKANQAYAQSISCVGNTGACVFSQRESTLPAGISFDATAGLISGVASEPGTSSITIDAYDAVWRTGSTTLALKVAPPDFSIMLPGAADAQVGKIFAITPAVTGAIGATTWSVVSGSGALPPGLTLDMVSGVIGGVPTAAGTFTLGVTATDSWTEAPRTAPAKTTIAVRPADLSIDPTTLANATVGTPYTASLTATGGTGSTIWSIKTGQLPDGMTLDASGVLSGTPTAAASSTFTVRAADAVYATTFAEATLALTVDAPAPVEPLKAVREVVLYAGDATRIAGTWSIVADASAAGGKRVWNKDNAAPKLTAALANPANYFELTFNADAGVAYHLWLRGKADLNSWASDSVYVQFAGSVNAAGTAINRIGTTSAATVSIEDGTNAGLSGWGWADDSYAGFASPTYFATTGTQTIRIQVREDGLSLDQIVLSADRFAAKAPGATKNDTTILTNAAADPTITIDAASLADATYGAPYAATLSATGSTGSTIFSVLSGQLPAGVTLDASGALNGTPASLGDFSFTVQAQDADWHANVAAAPFALKVVPPAFGVNPPAVSPAAMVGQPYAAGFTASGNVGNVVWTIVSGELPAGLTLDAASGTISGVPTVWGMFAVAVQGADSLGRAASATVAIVASPTPLTISTTAIAGASYKTSYSATLTADGGTGSIAWTLAAGSLPSGMTLNAASGVLSGTPTQAGTFVFDVRAVDSKWEGDADTKTITLLVQPPVFSSAVAPAAVSGRVGVALQPIAGSADGNVGNVKWSLASGTLPAGVALHTMSGNISGTPTVFGRFNANVKAEDSWDASRFVVSPVAIEVAPTALSVNAVTLPAATVGRAYNYTLVTTGGTGLATWRVSGGALPAGFGLVANGALTGTPTAAGTFTFTVEATDAGWAGNVATMELKLTVGVREVVLYAAAATRVAGAWSLVADPTAAGGARMSNPDAAAAKLTAALANPTNYFEVTFQAEAGVAYHLWLRGKADKNAWANDSVYVQFAGSVDAAGAAINRIGTTGAATVSIEDGTNAGLSGWGWADDSYSGLGSAMYFATTGTQTVRIQVREDGVSLDQIVLSADKYAAVAPGATKSDATILER
jgi:putative Ig domain-containing protein